MNIWFVTSECAPFAKAGGLADVASALPKALAKLGHSMTVILPYYDSCREFSTETRLHFTVRLGHKDYKITLRKLQSDGVTYWFIDHSDTFSGGRIYGYYEGEGEKFLLFSKAVQKLITLLPAPDILHCNDWQTALLPFFIRTELAGGPETVLTLHNLEFQGTYSFDLLEQLAGVDRSFFNSEQLEYYGGTSFLKAGLLYAGKLVTVSPSFREESLKDKGMRLEGVLATRKADYTGILNGLGEEFAPENDAEIPVNYSQNNLTGKAACKAEYLRALGLEEGPLFGVVSRLWNQKGFDFLTQILPELLTKTNANFAVVGTGDPSLEKYFASLAEKYPARVYAFTGYSEPEARMLYAASDFFLMPSHFEPCGLAQLIAMKYGSLPVVHATGGLKDTVTPNVGFPYDEDSPAALLKACRQALALYRKPAALEKMRLAAMTKDTGWEQPAKEYDALYSELFNKNARS